LVLSGLYGILRAAGGALPVLSTFRASWVAAFILVPEGFLPVLWGWHSWAASRYGRHPRVLRAAAELAFALDVVGLVLLQGIA
jgi:hypothetical protein